MSAPQPTATTAPAVQPAVQPAASIPPTPHAGPAPDTPGAPPGADPLRLAVIIGSVREGRFGPVVARWFAEHAAAHADLDVDLVDLAELTDGTLPLRMSDSADAADAAAHLAERLAAADAFTVVTPEYNHSYPAALKNVIDWHHREWHAKPVGFVSYGGLSGGLRAVEHLRQVFAELHAVTIRDTVSFHDVWLRFDGGRPADPGPAGAAATTMLNQLAWWGRALRDARAVRPYAA